MTAKVFTVAHVPEALVQAWLQHLRDFDVAHPGCHFEVMADAPEMSFMDMLRQVQVTPGLTFQQIIERSPGGTAITTALERARELAGKIKSRRLGVAPR
jgi:hypothetical protein